MGLIAVGSAKGSPGVTTVALLLGTLWPRMSVVAECDPSGGDIAWRMPGADGRPLDSQTGLLSLVAAGRRALEPGLVLRHGQAIVGGQLVIAGMSAPEQAGSVPWSDLGGILAEAPGFDVVADLGRIGAKTPQSALLDVASAVVMVVDTVPSSVVHLRDRLIRIQNAKSSMLRPPTHVVVVALPKRQRAVHEVEEALTRSEAEVEAVHHLAFDPKGAGFFLGQVQGRADRTSLVRSAQPLVAALADRTEAAYTEAEHESGEPVLEPASSEHVEEQS